MNAYAYKIEIQNDPVHSYTKRMITEVYIPELKIIFNHECAFFDEGLRFESVNERHKNTVKEFEIDREFAILMRDRIELETNVKEKQRKLLKELEEIHQWTTQKINCTPDLMLSKD